MKSHGLDMIGNIHAEELSSLPTWVSTDERRIIYVAGSLYIGGSSNWEEIIVSNETQTLSNKTITSASNSLTVSGSDIIAGSLSAAIIGNQDVSNTELSHINGLAAPPLVTDSTAGRVLRMGRMEAWYHSASPTISIYFYDVFNGYGTSGAEGIAPGGSSSGFELSADGTKITLNDTLITDTPVAALGWITSDYTTYHDYRSQVDAIAGGIQFKVRIGGYAGSGNWSTILDSYGYNIVVDLIYITNG